MKTTPLFASSLLLLTTLTSSLGCSATSESESGAEDVESSEAAIVSCGSAKYNEALAHYKNAVAWSKDRLAQGVCESEKGYLWSIADEASRAVMTCGTFRETIKSSPWAAPVRTVLAPSLTLRSLTGELAVIKDSPYQNWTGTEAHFSKGLSFWARAEGAYGSAVKIDFRAGGDATWGYLHYDEVSGDISWRTMPATYTVAKTAGENGKRRVTVVHGGVTETFDLGVESGSEYQDAPVFTLVPATGTTAPKLYSLVSECDA
jgi:hypothetical protein